MSPMNLKVIGAKVLLGSATPSINSYHKLPTTRLKGTYHGSSNNIIYDTNQTQITQLLLDHINITLKKSQQVIIFLPTRANFKLIECKKCGNGIECPYCSVNMSLHKSNNYLRCHYCNYTSQIPQVCPSCGSDELVSSRIGTAEVLQILTQKLPNINIAKFDKDQIKTQKELKNILNDFNDKKIDILVGTQMIAKGHNYLNVGLSIVMGIDYILQIPDFKSRQKALSTALQVAGRSGRKNNAKVIIQTLHREFFEVYMQDYKMFLDDEKKFALNLYPPYVKLARVLFVHKNPQKAQLDMQNMLSKLKNLNNIEVVGFGESPIFKISNKFRYQILLRSKDAKSLLSAIYYAKTPTCLIDIDPVSFS